MTAAAGRHRRAARERVVDVLLHLRDGGLVDQRALLDPFVEAVADAEALTASEKRSTKAS